MLADEVAGSAPQTTDEPGGDEPASGRWGDLAARTVTVLATAGLVLAYALPNGTYDVVLRQQYGLVIWAVVALGFATGLLPRARPSRVALILAGALAAYVAWTGLSLAWSESAERTTAELARGLDYLGLLVLLGSVLDRRLWRSAAAGLAVGAITVCALSVASRLFPGGFPPDTVDRLFATDRLSYPFGYWNAVAAWGAMTCAICLVWGANDGPVWRRALWMAGLPIAGTMIYLSYSRAGVGGVVVALIAVLAFSRRRWVALVEAGVAGFGVAVVIATIRAHPQIAHATGTRGAGSVLAVLLFACALSAFSAWLCSIGRGDRWGLPRSGARWFAGACTVVAVVLGIGFGPHLISKGWHEFRNPALPSAGSNPTQRLTTLSGTRYNLWSVAVGAFDNHLLTGTGAGTYEFVWNRNQKDTEFVLNAHSIWFETMAELGVPGLIAMIAFAAGAVAVLVRVRRRARRPMTVAAAGAPAAAFVVFLLHASVDWMWQSTAIAVLALAGVAAASARLASGKLQLRWWGRGAIALAAALAAVAQIPGIQSTLELRRSQAAEQRGDGPHALAWAHAAVNSEPWAATTYDQLALVQESAGNLAAAAADLRHAIANEPTDYTHWLLLARVQTERGDAVLAARDYARAHSLQREGVVFNLPLPLPRSVIELAGG
jgi:hypothetical protein